MAPDGVLWFSTRGGISCYNGQTWTTFATEDGLTDNHVSAIAVASDGALWLGTLWGGGVSRYSPAEQQ